MKRLNAIDIGSPTDFMFQLTPAEFDTLKAQTANSSQIAMSSGKHPALTSQIAISNAAAAGVGRFLMPLLSTAHFKLQMFFAAHAPFR